jgi:tetraacyldisaccharide 4'-kinase
VNPERVPGWLLWPFTIPYGAVARLRARLYRAGILRQKRLGGTVISVGNLTVGGTGKTPMALWIAERLAAEGKRAAILTRGYRGQTSGGGTTSDEAQLLRRRLGERAEVSVGADRYASGRELEKRGVSWFVLDDGFQHMQLARDVDIVLVDATIPFGGRLLPAGRRREPRSALGRADIVVIMRSSHAPAVEAAIRRHTSASIFYARPELQSIRKLSGDASQGNGVVDFTALQSRKLFAFCGIGNPAAFAADLRRWNLPVAGQKFFRDHHRYQQSDMDALVQKAHEACADALVCTEKDVFNLRGVRCDAMRVFYCVIGLHLDRDDEFWSAVMRTAADKEAAHGNRG